MRTHLTTENSSIKLEQVERQLRRSTKNTQILKRTEKRNTTINRVH
ncbi:MAG: hypothetical protein IPH32_16330 [Bacteroidetes bacterium]|nr:hypothetical protein [Bacteroidota bacterium]